MSLDLGQLAELSHELKTPLVAIEGFARILEEQHAQLQPEEIVEFLRIIRSNSRKLEKILDLWMDAAKLRDGEISVKPEKIELPAAIEDTVREYQILARERGLQVNLVKPDRPIALKADPIRLSQIVTNLLSNALKYTERGAVSVSFEKSKAQALIKVRDTGIGMSEGDANQVFEKYFRTEKSKDHASGHGIGLFIAQQLVHAMGGQISVQSEPGQGTEFMIQLPLA